jgi:hypothetical protein
MTGFLGICKFGAISKKRRNYWEIQLFSKVRDYSDGIYFFNFKINLDRYHSYHSPRFEIELDFLNIHNHLWIYKSNPD